MISLSNSRMPRVCHTGAEIIAARRIIRIIVDTEGRVKGEEKKEKEEEEAAQVAAETIMPRPDRHYPACRVIISELGQRRGERSLRCAEKKETEDGKPARNC